MGQSLQRDLQQDRQSLAALRAENARTDLFLQDLETARRELDALLAGQPAMQPRSAQANRVLRIVSRLLQSVRQHGQSSTAPARAMDRHTL